MSPEAAPAADPARLYRDVLERSPHPTVVVEGPGHVVAYSNAAFAGLVGRAPAALVGRPFADAVPDGAAGGRAALVDRVSRSGASETLAEQATGHTPNAFWSYSAWAAPGAGGRPAGVVVQVTDATQVVTFRERVVAVNEALLTSAARQHELAEAVARGEQERRNLEAKMLQAQKLESLGLLAGGLAHDLNNMLTPVLGFADLARQDLPDDSPAGPMLDEVSAGARRATGLVQQILAYAGRGQTATRPVDLSGLVLEMHGLLGAAVPAGVDFRCELPRGLPEVEADVAQLQQVVLNLVTNAAEATGRGGVITVATAAAAVGPGEVWSAHLRTHLPAGAYVSLEVADTGCGMTADVLDRIFDPFFTTKFAGRGLGLAAVQGIAHGHGGVLRAGSKPGVGSAFRLLLPCPGVAPPGPATPVPVVPWRAAGTVLVIDDDEVVRNTAVRVLERAGLIALSAGDGEGGLEVFRAHARAVDAVVLDLTMPGMGGAEAAAALRAVRADVPVVLMSGYSARDPAHQAAVLGASGFVQKPFTAAVLLAAVRLALGR